jgi:formylmethanofuran dehydrogenase subunit E
MLDKIYLTLNIKPTSQDDQVVQDIIKKSKPSNDVDKQREDAFNLLLEDKINEEQNLRQIRKKAKKIDEPSVLMIPNFVHTTKITNSNLLKIGNNKTNRCSRCGNLMDAEDSVEVNLEKRSTFVCSKCMNKEIVDFLTYNYL